MTMPIRRPPAKKVLCSVCKVKVPKDAIIENLFDDGKEICIRCARRPVRQRRRQPARFDDWVNDYHINFWRAPAARYRPIGNDHFQQDHIQPRGEQQGD